MAYKWIKDEYYTVDILPFKEEDKRPQVYHDRSKGERGSLSLDINLREDKWPSPLHVGSGDLEMDKGELFQPFIRWEGMPGIPGTGIKGAIRAYAEALSPSCEGGNCKKTNVCLCCSLFGYLGFMGRVNFSDAILKKSPEAPKMGRVSLPLRWGGRVKKGRRFYWHCDYRFWMAKKEKDMENLEVVLPPATFQSHCTFDNLTEEEQGLLYLSMGLVPGYSFSLKLGGAKNRGLGSVFFQLHQWHIDTGPSSYHSFELDNTGEVFNDKAQRAAEKYLYSLKGEQRGIVENNLKAFQDAELPPERLEELYSQRIKAQQDKKKGGR